MVSSQKKHLDYEPGPRDSKFLNETSTQSYTATEPPNSA